MTCTGTSCNQGREPCRDGCTNLIQTNSDGTSPHTDTRELVELVLDGLVFVLGLSAIVFTILAAAGYFSTH